MATCTEPITNGSSPKHGASSSSCPLARRRLILYHSSIMAKYDSDDFREPDPPFDHDPNDALASDDAAEQPYEDVLETQPVAWDKPGSGGSPVVASPSSIAPSGVACAGCGYDLTGVPLGGECPECGMPVSKSFQAMRQPGSGMAVASMVLGIVSIPACICYGIPGLPCGILAIIFYFQVKKDIKTGKVGAHVHGQAMAGLICGIIGTALGTIGVGFLVFVMIMSMLNP